MNIFKKQKINRFVSLTFDDGLIKSAFKISDIITPHNATFYVVTGWIEPRQVTITDYANIFHNHGSISDWKIIAQKGHEIGSHSFSHLKPENSNTEKEYIQSFDFINKFGDAPYSMAMPYGLKFNKTLPYDSIRLCDGKKIFNSLEKIDLKNLTSFDPFENGLTIERAIKKINETPSNSWIIIRAHGLDDDGFCPWPTDYFKKLYFYLMENNFHIQTVRQMTSNIKLKF